MGGPARTTEDGESPPSGHVEASGRKGAQKVSLTAPEGRERSGIIRNPASGMHDHPRGMSGATIVRKWATGRPTAPSQLGGPCAWWLSRPQTPKNTGGPPRAKPPGEVTPGPEVGLAHGHPKGVPSGLPAIKTPRKRGYDGRRRLGDDAPTAGAQATGGADALDGRRSAKGSYIW